MSVVPADPREVMLVLARVVFCQLARFSNSFCTACLITSLKKTTNIARHIIVIRSLDPNSYVAWRKGTVRNPSPAAFHLQPDDANLVASFFKTITENMG
jgi:hypothetical protein